MLASTTNINVVVSTTNTTLFGPPVLLPRVG